MTSKWLTVSGMLMAPTVHVISDTVHIQGRRDVDAVRGREGGHGKTAGACGAPGSSSRTGFTGFRTRLLIARNPYVSADPPDDDRPGQDAGQPDFDGLFLICDGEATPTAGSPRNEHSTRDGKVKIDLADALLEYLERFHHGCRPHRSWACSRHRVRKLHPGERRETRAAR